MKEAVTLDLIKDNFALVTSLLDRGSIQEDLIKCIIELVEEIEGADKLIETLLVKDSLQSRNFMRIFESSLVLKDLDIQDEELDEIKKLLKKRVTYKNI